MALFDTHVLRCAACRPILDGFFEMNTGRVLTLLTTWGALALSIGWASWDVLMARGLGGWSSPGLPVRYRPESPGLPAVPLRTRLLGLGQTRFLTTSSRACGGETLFATTAVLRTGVTQRGRLAPVD